MALLALVAALVCFVIATLLGFDIFSGAHLLGWLSLGFVFFTVAIMLGANVIAAVRNR